MWRRVFAADITVDEALDAASAFCLAREVSFLQASAVRSTNLDIRP